MVPMYIVGLVHVLSVCHFDSLEILFVFLVYFLMTNGYYSQFQNVYMYSQLPLLRTPSGL